MTHQDAIRITRIIDADITPSRKGGALREVPFELSAHPDDDWERLFVQTWDRPDQFTSRHRPGIARVEGNRIVLDGVTMDEVAEVHRDMMIRVVDATNKKWADLRLARERQNAQDEAHRHAAQAELDQDRSKARDIKF